jgi:hypothetical protein
MADNLENRIGSYNKQKRLFTEHQVKVSISTSYFYLKELYLPNFERTSLLSF